MSLINGLWKKSLRATTKDSESGLLGKIVELLGHLGRPNEIKAISKATSAAGKGWVNFASSAGVAIRGDNSTGTGLTFRRKGTNTADAAATLTTSLTGTNNDLVITAKTAGLVGNDITVALVDPSGNNQALAVTVTALAISASLATGAGGAITTTAAQLKAAIDALPAAAALVTVANAASNDGTGVVTALTATNLTGGTDTAVPTTAVASGAAMDLPCVANANEWEFRRTDSSNTPVTLLGFLYNSV